MNRFQKRNGCLSLAWAGMVLAMACGVCWGAVYVDVETEVGTFTIEMDAGARNGGAAFLGLAEGWVDWVDPRTGEPQHGKRYHEGTSMSWVYKDAGGEAMAVGNLGFAFRGALEEKPWNNGGGIQMQDDIAGPTGLTARSVAMVQGDGPHSLNGRWAVLLKNADEDFGGRWSRIGTVASNWGVVEALAGRALDAGSYMEEPVEVTGTRMFGDEREISAWRALAESNAPTCGLGEVGLTPGAESVILHYRMEGKGQFATVHTTNLLDRVRVLDWLDWSEGEGMTEKSLELSTAEGAMGKRHFFGIVTAEYPELGGPTMEGEFSFLAQWEMGEGQEDRVYHYDLDMASGTGMVYRLDAATRKTELGRGRVTLIRTERRGAHSMGIEFVVNGGDVQWPHYWLGEEKAGDGKGRCRLQEWMRGVDTYGNWEKTEKWNGGKGKARRKGRDPNGDIPSTGEQAGSVFAGHEEIGDGTGGRRESERDGRRIQRIKNGHEVLGVVGTESGLAQFVDQDQRVGRSVGIGSNQRTEIVAGDVGDGEGDIGSGIGAVGEDVQEGPLGEDGKGGAGPDIGPEPREGFVEALGLE